jgi:hypothetical protein
MAGALRVASSSSCRAVAPSEVLFNLLWIAQVAALLACKPRASGSRDVAGIAAKLSSFHAQRGGSCSGPSDSAVVSIYEPYCGAAWLTLYFVLGRFSVLLVIPAAYRAAASALVLKEPPGLGGVIYFHTCFFWLPLFFEFVYMDFVVELLV